MKRTFASVIAVMAIIGVVASMLSAGLDNSETFLSSTFSTLKYFTLQSNIIVIIYFSFYVFNKYTEKPGFQKLLGAVTTYITVTFLVFAVLIQGGYHPVGLALLGSILNHYLVPLMTILFFTLYRNGFDLKFRDTLSWLIYPFVYFVFLLIHGLISGDYIYPFFQLKAVGILNFLIATVGILLLFFMISNISIILKKIKKS